MQLIFKPRAGLETVPEAFTYQTALYGYLLRRHLEEKYGERRAALDKATRLTGLMEQLKEGRVRHVRFLESLDAKLVPELAVELFSLTRRWFDFFWRSKKAEGKVLLFFLMFF